MAQMCASRASIFTFHVFCAHYLGAGYTTWGKGKVPMTKSTKVIERVEAHYEVQDVEMGKVYRWRPANVLVECTCGEEPSLSAFRTTCGECGADHVAFVGDLLDARTEDKGDHPWRYLQPYTPTRGT